MKKIILLFCILFLVGCNEDNKQNDIKKETPTINIKESNETNINNVEKFTKYDIKGNKLIDIAPAGESSATTKQITAFAFIKNPYESINIKLIQKRLSKNFIVKCSACHNNYANGVIGPSLLDKSEEEIEKMITAYKNNDQKNVLMKDLVSKMPDSEIKSLAKDISEFNAQIKRTKNENR